jgi:hypothetical protein
MAAAMSAIFWESRRDMLNVSFSGYDPFRQFRAGNRCSAMTIEPHFNAR